MYSFKPIPSFFGMCILLINSSQNGRFGRSPKPSTAKNRRFSRLSRDLRFFSNLAASLAKPTVEFELKRGKSPDL